MCNRHSCMYNSQDTIIPYIEYFVIRTCHKDKLYHKGHKGSCTYVTELCYLYHRTLYGIDSKTFVYKCQKVYICVCHRGRY